MKFWIARDSNGELWAYNHKPIQKYGIFQSDFELDKCVASELPEWVLPEVPFENSPQEVELVIKKVCSKS